MKVAEVMSKHLVKVSPGTKVPEAAQKMRQENIGVLPVEENGHLVGIVTDRDIALNGVAAGKVDCPVNDIMTKAPATIQQTATLEAALETMMQRNVRRLPVMDDGHVVGIVSLEDLAEGENGETVLKALRFFHKKTKHS